MTKLRFLLLSFILIQLFLPVHVVSADTGPKPTMTFEFEQEWSGEKLTILLGILYECEQPDCSDAAPLEELGPQRFMCEAESCRAMAYGFSPYHKLEIQFSDGKTRQSQVFETAGFNSRYTVKVRQDDLLVDARFSLPAFSPMNIVILACMCTLAGGILIIGLIVFIIRRSTRK